MRLLSVSLTEQQVIARTKTVTRRLGWQPGKMVNAGDRLCLVRKAMGRKRADGTVDPLVRLAVVEVLSARREPLNAIYDDPDEVAREGFAGWLPGEFVSFFTQNMRCRSDDLVTRIEFRYDDEAYIRMLAAEVFKPEGVDLWYDAPNRALDGRTPRDLVDAGEWYVPGCLIHALAEGVIA